MFKGFADEMTKEALSAGMIGRARKMLMPVGGANETIAGLSQILNAGVPLSRAGQHGERLTGPSVVSLLSGGTIPITGGLSRFINARGTLGRVAKGGDALYKGEKKQLAKLLGISTDDISKSAPKVLEQTEGKTYPISRALNSTAANIPLVGGPAISRFISRKGMLPRIAEQSGLSRMEAKMLEALENSKTPKLSPAAIAALAGGGTAAAAGGAAAAMD